MQQNKFNCIWCNKRPATRGWACGECYKIKEEAYKINRQQGNKRKWAELIQFVNQKIATNYE